MTKQFGLYKKSFVFALFSLFIFALLSAFTFTSSSLLNTQPANAETTASDINLSINSALALSLTNCDLLGNLDTSINNQVINLDIIPTPNGLFKSTCQTLEVLTNTPGYSLTARAEGVSPDYNSGAITNNLLYQNPIDLTALGITLPTIPSTTNPINTPTTLTTNTWGFAVEGLNPTTTPSNEVISSIPNFDTTYTLNNQYNNYAELPINDTTLYKTTAFPLPKIQHNFFYGAKLDTTTLAGTYATTITYTAIGEDVPEPVTCDGENSICIKVTEPGTIAIQNLWSTPITYRINGSDKISITSSGLSTNLNVAIGDVIEVEESLDNVTFRTWSGSMNRGFVTNSSSISAARVSITKMPPMNRFTTDTAGTTAGNTFFRYFAGTNNTNTNYPAAINSLPSGSFDTSSITSTGRFFFYNFNSYGVLTSLPAGSFDTSNITTVGNSFFFYFNNTGSLTFLPEGSFDISSITSTGDSFFNSFNSYGDITSLPAGSFDTSNVTTTGTYFFSAFNFSGDITSLPAGSFDTSNITTTGDYFFTGFNRFGALTSLPVGSFDTSNILSTGNRFFENFNGETSSDAGKLQAGTGVTITNKSSLAVTFWQRPFGNPDEDAFSTDVSAGGEITFLAQ